MDATYWHRQTPEKPLFGGLIWSRPENRALAGKLAVIGGNLHGFAAPAEAYTEASKAGIGVTRVLLPLAVKTLVRSILTEVDYAASNPSGSFSQKALDGWMEVAMWADATLIAGDLGRNSETAIVFEKFVTKYPGQLTITKDAGNYALAIAPTILARPDTTLVLSMAQLQKFGMQAGLVSPITFSMSLIQLTEALHDITERYPINIIVKYHETACVAVGGQVSTTNLGGAEQIWRVRTAAHAATWWLQNPSQPFEALTTSLIAASSELTA
jgi:hypothetical protein